MKNRGKTESTLSFLHSEFQCKVLSETHIVLQPDRRIPVLSPGDILVIIVIIVFSPHSVCGHKDVVNLRNLLFNHPKLPWLHLGDICRGFQSVHYQFIQHRVHRTTRGLISVVVNASISSMAQTQIFSSPLVLGQIGVI